MWKCDHLEPASKYNSPGVYVEIAVPLGCVRAYVCARACCEPNTDRIFFIIGRPPAGPPGGGAGGMGGGGGGETWSMVAMVVIG